MSGRVLLETVLTQEERPTRTEDGMVLGYGLKEAGKMEKSSFLCSLAVAQRDKLPQAQALMMDHFLRW